MSKNKNIDKWYELKNSKFIIKISNKGYGKDYYEKIKYLKNLKKYILKKTIVLNILMIIKKKIIHQDII